MSMFWNLPVARKFVLAFGSICIFCALLGAIALWGLSKMNDSSNSLAQIALPSAHNLAQMESAMQIYRRADMGILLCDTEDCAAYYLKTRQRVSAQFEAAGNAYRQGGAVSEESTAVESASTEFDRYTQASDRTVTLLRGGDKAQAGKLTVGDNALIFRKADADLAKAIEANTRASRQLCLNATATYRSARMMALGTLAFTLILSTAIGWLLTRSIVPPLIEATGVLEAVAAKDLTASAMSMERTDEIGRMAAALNTAVSTIRSLIGSMQHGVETVSAAAAELSATADKSSEQAALQCSETNQIATATQEMASTVAEVSKNAEQANSSSREVARTANEGGEAISRTADRMQGISEFTNRTVDKMATLARRSEQIGEVVTTIREISEQTNLLALNAAIEAQRAGEHGRGFAVVAGEVRRLAERTKSATEEITGTIVSIQSETRETLKLMEQGKTGVVEGLAESQNARRTLEAIIDLAHRSEEQIAMIATASTEEAAASGEISKSLARICEISALASTGAAETTQASRDLSRLAADLDKEIMSFQLADRGGARSGKPGLSKPLGYRAVSSAA